MYPGIKGKTQGDKNDDNQNKPGVYRVKSF